MDPNYQYFILAGLNGVSALACSFLLFKFFRFACGATWLKMLLILVFFDLIYHISRIIYNFGEKPNYFDINQGLGNFSTRFSMFWVLVIAYFLYRVLKSREFDKPNLYIVVSFIFITGLSIGLTFGAKEVEDSNKVPGEIILRVVPFLLSTVPSIYFYFKARKFYKELAITKSLRFVEKIMQTLFWFSLIRIPIPAFFLIFFDTYYDINRNFQDHHIILFIVDIPMSISGLFDCLIYFWRRDVIEENTDRELETELVHASLNSTPT